MITMIIKTRDGFEILNTSSTFFGVGRWRRAEGLSHLALIHSESLHVSALKAVTGTLGGGMDERSSSLVLV